MENTLRGKVFRSGRSAVALGSGAVLLAGCSFGGLNSMDMPGTAGHGSGSYTITVELPDVATLPQNSPVMVDDVTVGSVSGIDAVQRPDGTFYAAVKLSVESDVNLPENSTATVAQTSLLGSQHVELSRPTGKAEGRLKEGSNIPLERTGRYPTTTDGGLMSFSHGGATVQLLQRVLRGVEQLRGQCATNQVPDAKVAMCSGGGSGALFTDVMLLGSELA